MKYLWNPLEISTFNSYASLQWKIRCKQSSLKTIIGIWNLWIWDTYRWIGISTQHKNRIAKCELHTKFSYWYYYSCFLFLFLFLVLFVIVLSLFAIVLRNFSTAMFVNVPFFFPFAMILFCVRFIFGSSSWGGILYFSIATISCAAEGKITFFSFNTHSTNCKQTNLTFIEQTTTTHKKIKINKNDEARNPKMG